MKILSVMFLVGFDFLFSGFLFADDVDRLYLIQEEIAKDGYSKAKDDLVNYLKDYPDSYIALTALGKAEAMEGEYEKSISSLEEAKVIQESNNINDASIYNSIGWVKFLSGNPDEAILNIEKAVEQAPDLDPVVAEAAYNNLGLIYMYQNKNDLAEAAFKSAAEDYGSEYAKENLLLIDRVSKDAVVE